MGHYLLAENLDGSPRWGPTAVINFVFGLRGIVATQVLLSVCLGNLDHRSHPGEIKEFLFLTGFLAFSLRVTMPCLGNCVARLKLL